MGRKPLFTKLIISIVILILLSGTYYFFSSKKISENKEDNYTGSACFKKERAALESFVNKYFLKNGFFRTNLINIEQGETASGEDILSESMGLLMLYYLKMDQVENFDKEVNLLMDYFLNYNKLFKWRIRRGFYLDTVNAAIDDLRIVKALIMAADRWERKEYKSTAEKLSTRLLKYNVSGKNLQVCDCIESSSAPFVYYDLKSMQLMGQFDNRWSDLVNIHKEIILNKQVKGFPFYRDKLYSEEQGFPTVENLMVMMYLSEIGIKDLQSIKWLKKQLRHEGLFGRYSLEGKPLNSIESPAIYAIAAIIGKINNDRELYYLAIKRLRGMQNLKSGRYYGGFINLSNRSAFSFDQLFALLAY